ncbi:MAG: hypothetical protein AAF740_08490 [Bacteroidota bacterium]
MVTLTVQGIYRDGKLELESQVPFSEPTEVVVIFLSRKESNRDSKRGLKKFSFGEAQQMTQNWGGTSLSTIVVEERRNESIFFNK